MEEEPEAPDFLEGVWDEPFYWETRVLPLTLNDAALNGGGEWFVTYKATVAEKDMPNYAGLYIYNGMNFFFLAGPFQFFNDIFQGKVTGEEKIPEEFVKFPVKIQYDESEKAHLALWFFNQRTESMTPVTVTVTLTNDKLGFAKDFVLDYDPEAVYADGKKYRMRILWE